MGYLEKCPVVHRFCFLPLRTAVMVIAFFGLNWSAWYLFLFSSAGASWIAASAGRSEVTDALRYVHGALGVLLAALHLLLLAVAAYESDSLCDVFVWGMLVCWAGVLVSAVALAGAAVLANNLWFATCFLFCVLLIVLMSFYDVIVVVNYKMTIP